MYSNDQSQIRQGLVSYIGAIIESSPYEGRAARQSAAAILVEEAIKIAQEDTDINYFVLKPLLRGSVFTLNKKIEELLTLPAVPEVKSMIKDYRSTVTRLEGLINTIN